MRFGYLGSADSWYFRDLQRATDGHQWVCLSFAGLQAAVGLEAPAVSANADDLRSIDAVLVRVMSPGSLEQVVFRMDALAQYERNGGVLINPAKTVEAAVDKYLALAKIAACGIPVPPTVVCQTAQQALTAFYHLGTDVVVKPLFGSEGRGICRVTDEAVAERVFRTLENIQAVVYLQKYIDHGGRDYRLLVVGKQLLGIERVHPNDWRTNLSRGGKAMPLKVTGDLAELAFRVAEAVGATFAGVDVLESRSGERYVIEVNASPGWRGVQQATKCDVARLVVEHLVEAANRRSATRA